MGRVGNWPGMHLHQLEPACRLQSIERDRIRRQPPPTTSRRAKPKVSGNLNLCLWSVSGAGVLQKGLMDPAAQVLQAMRECEAAGCSEGSGADMRAAAGTDFPTIPLSSGRRPFLVRSWNQGSKVRRDSSGVVGRRRGNFFSNFSPIHPFSSRSGVKKDDLDVRGKPA